MTMPESQPAGQGQTQTPAAPVTPPVTPPATPPTPQQSAAPAEPPQFVTKTELEAAIAKVVSKAQSMDGKAYAAIQEQIKTLKAAGIEATPDQVQKLIENQQQQGANQGNAQPPAPDQTPPAVTDPANTQNTPAAQPPLTAEQVTLKGYQIMAQAGVVINDDDPEVEKIRQDVSPEEWLADLQAAITAKAERLSKEGNPARMPNLVGGSPSSQPAHAGLSGMQTLERAHRKN